MTQVKNITIIDVRSDNPITAAHRQLAVLESFKHIARRQNDHITQFSYNRLAEFTAAQHDLCYWFHTVVLLIVHDRYVVMGLSPERDNIQPFNPDTWEQRLSDGS